MDEGGGLNVIKGHGSRNRGDSASESRRGKSGKPVTSLDQVVKRAESQVD